MKVNALDVSQKESYLPKENKKLNAVLYLLLPVATLVYLDCSHRLACKIKKSLQKLASLQKFAAPLSKYSKTVC